MGLELSGRTRASRVQGPRSNPSTDHQKGAALPSFFPPSLAESPPCPAPPLLVGAFWNELFQIVFYFKCVSWQDSFLFALDICGLYLLSVSSLDLGFGGFFCLFGCCFVVVVVVFVCLFLGRIYLSSPGWLVTHQSPASTSIVLGLQACTATPGSLFVLTCIPKRLSV